MTHFEHLVTTPIKKDSCDKCRASIWTGWVTGILTKTDVEPLDLMGELRARLAGRATYQAKKHDQSFKLVKRDQFNIQPDDHNHKTILALHECNPTGMITEGHPNYFANRYELVITERPPF